VLHKGVERGPSVTPSLTAPIQPFEKKPLSEMAEPLKTRGIANDSIVVPVGSILRVESGKEPTKRLVMMLLDPSRKVGQRRAQLLVGSAALHKPAPCTAFFPPKPKPKEVKATTACQIKPTKPQGASLVRGNFEPKPLQPSPALVHKPLGIFLILKSTDKVIRKTDEHREYAASRK